jgi:hypothetical protein
MKTLLSVLAMSLVLFTTTTSNIANAQGNPVPKPKPITGSEQIKIKESEKKYKVNPNYNTKFAPLITKSGTVLFSSLPVSTVYDLQSNGVPQQIWQDPIMPANVHAVFMYSLRNRDLPQEAVHTCSVTTLALHGITWLTYRQPSEVAFPL